ncbi:hypothetical protein MNBD_ALPHA12-1899, partial [hydrothermal vent metagenome]
QAATGRQAAPVQKKPAAPRTAKKAYLSEGNAAIDSDWNEF